MNLESNIEKIDTEKVTQFMFIVLLNLINNFIQQLHNIAENRVMRGEYLRKKEIVRIQEMTKLYDKIVVDILPKMNLSSNEVLELPPSTIQSIIQNKIPDKNIDSMLENMDECTSFQGLEFKYSDVETFKQNFIYRVGEEIIQSGVIIKLKDSKKLLRYLVVTNYQVLVAESVSVLEFAVDLPCITKG